MAIEIVDFPINSMVDLSIAMLVHQRVCQFIIFVPGSRVRLPLPRWSKDTRSPSSGQIFKSIEIPGGQVKIKLRMDRGYGDIVDFIRVLMDINGYH